MHHNFNIVINGKYCPDLYNMNFTNITCTNILLQLLLNISYSFHIIHIVITNSY